MSDFKIGSVFVHVKDANKAANWYANLLGKPEPQPTAGPVQFMETADGRGLVIDDNRKNAPGIRPAFMLETTDIKLAYERVSEQGGKIVRELEEDAAVAFFNFEDPDGNIVMVCEQRT
ncbi:VOC family protein [Terribacillus saccharophilus]|uniref:VOC family protein n=1 Tax=Terribacillus saccharophilus TaxID=361277 RepID=UPI0039822757